MIHVQLHNIKAHIKVDPEGLEKHLASLQPPGYHLFSTKILTFYIGNCAIFVFPKSGIINISGLTSFHQVKPILYRFLKKYDVNLKEKTQLFIDNTTATCKVRSGINLLKLYKVLQVARGKKGHINIERLKVNTTHFPCLRVGTNIGKVAIFSTGSIVLLGCSTSSNIIKLAHYIEASCIESFNNGHL